ncbi:hypothetical protein SDC9_132272 [bioreactor metagenome]|uniref:Uncharacterized protein n=1 Tax=bioreactor metagenome TaxID=1076179 RepID=A0A645D774_9ZZZZ
MRFFPRMDLSTPAIAMLLDSVPPEVKSSSLAEQPRAAARFARANSTAFSAATAGLYALAGL